MGKGHVLGIESPTKFFTGLFVNSNTKASQRNIIAVYIFVRMLLCLINAFSEHQQDPVFCARDLFYALWWSTIVFSPGICQSDNSPETSILSYACSTPCYYGVLWLA